MWAEDDGKRRNYKINGSFSMRQMLHCFLTPVNGDGSVKPNADGTERRIVEVSYHDIGRPDLFLICTEDAPTLKLLDDEKYMFEIYEHILGEIEDDDE
ncbi:MAG: hypothetical protein LUD29_02435 [Clostridia bacterium]|nr:hypothetical protein [Clostridia bacterium]